MTTCSRVVFMQVKTNNGKEKKQIFFQKQIHTYMDTIFDKGIMQSSQERKKFLENSADEMGYPYGKKKLDN